MFIAAINTCWWEKAFPLEIQFLNTLMLTIQKWTRIAYTKKVEGNEQRNETAGHSPFVIVLNIDIFPGLN